MSSTRFNYYNPKLREFAREHRYESVSRAEKYLWKALLSRGRSGVKFKRQRPIDKFIVDFFSSELKLIIEIDGNSHVVKSEYDQYRQQKLESLGYIFLRFEEGEVIHQFQEVHDKIIHVVFVLKNR
ncbi:MAG: DUF559 domain-containing protein [Crocinitomicaceae bacterium]|nr:DUF559 domain-containing protein [Crocinitomicaceae bacterium]